MMQWLETSLLSCKGRESLRWLAFLHRSRMSTTSCLVFVFNMLYGPSTCCCVWIASSSIQSAVFECSNSTTPSLLLLSFHRLTFVPCEDVHGMDVPIHGYYLVRRCTFVSLLRMDPWCVLFFLSSMDGGPRRKGWIPTGVGFERSVEWERLVVSGLHPSSSTLATHNQTTMQPWWATGLVVPAVLLRGKIFKRSKAGKEDTGRR